jgi:hypothetical protein
MYYKICVQVPTVMDMRQTSWYVASSQRLKSVWCKLFQQWMLEGLYFLANIIEVQWLIFWQFEKKTPKKVKTAISKTLLERLPILTCVISFRKYLPILFWKNHDPNLPFGWIKNVFHRAWYINKAFNIYSNASNGGQ